MRFEWPGAVRGAAWAWVALALLLAVPWPAIQAPLIERAVPIFWLVAAGALVIAALVARASWPFAALFCWAGVRAAWMGIQVDPVSLMAGTAVMEVSRARPVQLLVLWAMAGLLYWAALELPERGARWASWAFLAGAGWQLAFGYLNLWHVYPWMTFVMPDQMGRPMGFLTHPNYWGSYLAMALPLAWALGGILPASAVYLMCAATLSGGPIISASAGAVLLVWPQLGRKLRWAAAGAAGTSVALVMTAHEWRLSGRREVWEAVWPELARYPWIGQGLGSWRVWADHYNGKLSAAQGKLSTFATLQAHNEPYQLWFELGLIGLVLAGCWALQAWTAVRRAWAEGSLGPGPWWAPGRVPREWAWVAVLVTAAVNSLGSPTFHLPGQAGLALFALARIQAAAGRAPEPKNTTKPVGRPRRRPHGGR